MLIVRRSRNRENAPVETPSCDPSNRISPRRRLQSSRVNRLLLSSAYLSLCFVFSFLSAYCLSVHIRICRRISHDIPDIPCGAGAKRDTRVKKGQGMSIAPSRSPFNLLFQFYRRAERLKEGERERESWALTCHRRRVCILGIHESPPLDSAPFELSGSACRRIPRDSVALADFSVNFLRLQPRDCSN